MTIDHQPDTQLRHVVLFGFTPETTEVEIMEIARRFGELRELIRGISGFEWGVNNSPEERTRASRIVSR